MNKLKIILILLISPVTATDKTKAATIHAPIYFDTIFLNLEKL